MVKLTDELLEALAEEYIEKGNKGLTFAQYLEFKLEALQRGMVYNG